MTQELWRLDATELAAVIAQRTASATEATHSVLNRIDQTNPRINALPDVMRTQALAAAEAADRAQAAGQALGPLHGVPVTIKVNIDTAGTANTDGIAAMKDNITPEDSPLVAHLRNAGAIIVGRSNTPAFSLRWFTDNDVHGRTLNPFDERFTPGGSSGGAAAAVACGMGPIAHGNDYGGSVRYPAWACGVVGLRTTAGRIGSYKPSSPSRGITTQLMSVQGPLTRSIADARLALEVMAQPTPLDPYWVPAPLDYAEAPKPWRVALFKRHPGYTADPSVVAALEQAAQWLTDAGCEVEEVEPPHFEEGAQLWRDLVYNDLRRGGIAAVHAMGDGSVRKNLDFCMQGTPDLSRDDFLAGLMRRQDISRSWSVFLEQYPVLLMPNSWERQLPVDDDTHSAARMQQILAAQSPLLGTAMLGLPGLSVPTGLSQGLPVGVQLVANRYREDRLLRAGALIEARARFNALEHLPF
jgi:amidase